MAIKVSLPGGRAERVVEPLGASEQVDYDAGLAAAPGVEAQAQARQANAGSLRGKIQAAIADNTAFLGNPTPSAAQLTAQVRGLTRQNVALIRLLAGILDSTDGT